MSERRHTSDTGPFVVIPVWVLDLPISHLALRLYAVHADHADRSGAHYHGRKALAERLGVTVRCIDDTHAALVKHGALEIRHRRDAQGDPASNLYIIRRTRPGVANHSSLPLENQGSPPGEPEIARGSEPGFSQSSKDSRNLNQNAGAGATGDDGAQAVDEPTPPPASWILPPLSERDREVGLSKVRQILRREDPT